MKQEESQNTQSNAKEPSNSGSFKRSRKYRDILNEQVNPDGAPKEYEDTELREDIPIGTSGMWLRKYKEGWIVTIGDYRVTTPVETREEAEIEIEGRSWKLLLNIIVAMVEIITSMKSKMEEEEIQELIKKHKESGGKTATDGEDQVPDEG